MTDFLEIDYCKSRSLRVARRFNVSDGITSEQLAGATSLGCRFPISHRNAGPHDGEHPGYILSRVDKQSGRDVQDLLLSQEEALLTNPGPTMWLSGCPDAFLASPIALPFPGEAPSVVPTLSSPAGPVQLSFQAIGLGGPTGLREMVLVPPSSLEYIAPATLALHNARWRFGCVSSPSATESFRLSYVNFGTVSGIRPVYIWPSVGGQGTQVTQFLGNDSHFIGVSVVGTPPVLAGHQTPVLTPTIDFATSQPHNSNGPGQTNRKFSYPNVGEFTNPDWNGSATPTLTLGGTRPTLTVYAQSAALADVGFDILSVDGSALTFGGASLPFEQYQTPPAFQEGSGGTLPTNFFNNETFVISSSPSITGTLYGQPDVAAQTNINLAGTSVTFQIHVAGSPTPTANITINLPKVAGQASWYEALITVWTQTT